MGRVSLTIMIVAFLFIGCDRAEEQDQYDEISVGYIYESFQDEDPSGLVTSITEVTEGDEEDGMVVMQDTQMASTTTTTVMRTDVSVATLPNEEVVEITERPVTTTTTTTMAYSYVEETTPSYYNPVEEVISPTTTTTMIQVTAGSTTYNVTVEEVIINAVSDVVSGDTAVDSYFSVGNGINAQSVSPRDYIKTTSVVFTDNSSAYSVDFQLYAFPKGGGVKRYGYNMLGYAYNVELINGQAQLTRYWNGKNVYGNFLEEGNYNLYIYYKIKSADGILISSGGKYWGGSDSYYITLQ